MSGVHKAKHEARIRDLEAAKLAELEEEWRAVELQREQLFADRQLKLVQLETQLKNALFEVEKQVRYVWPCGLTHEAHSHEIPNRRRDCNFTKKD